MTAELPWTSVGILPSTPYCDWYSEWGMRVWSVLGSVPLMGSGVFISSP